MRVLHVHSGNLYGGVETVLTTLVQEAGLRPGMRAAFAVCFEGRLTRELRASGGVVHMLGEVRVRNPLSVRRARRALAALLEKEQFDVVLVHSPWAHALFGPLARARGVPLAFWLHDASDGRHWLNRWARRTPPSLVIGASRFVASRARAFFPGTPVEVVYSPVQPAGSGSIGDREGVRRELGARAGDVLIIQAGRLERLKGHMPHLEALSALSDLPGWSCCMVGGGQRPHELAYLEELKRAAARLGIGDRVCFTGERDDVPLLLRAADLFCQPNTEPEAFGRVFVEALAAELPVITSAIGGAMEIVDDSCGILVDLAAPKQLVAALRALIGDEARRRALGAAGPARARELCDPERALARLEEVLSGVAQPSMGGS